MAEHSEYVFEPFRERADLTLYRCRDIVRFVRFSV